MRVGRVASPCQETIMLKSFLLSIAGLSLLASPAMAQSFPDNETIVVSATRIATPVSEIGGSVTVITAADIAARQQRALTDVLRDVPGLALAQSGGSGAQASLFTRGTNSNHTKVLLDGVDIGDAASPTGAADISKLLAGDIARVEVLRGPGSALYGSDAIGGVIDIVTKRGEGPAALKLLAEGGSFDTLNQTAALSGSDGAFHYAATLQHQHVGANPVTPLALLRPGETRNDDFYDNLSASTRLGYMLEQGFDISLVGRYANSLGKITNDAFDLGTFTSYPAAHRSRVDTLQYDGRIAAHLGRWGFDQTLGLGYSANAISSADPDNGYSIAAGERVKLDWQGSALVAEGQTLVMGAETAREAIHKPLSDGITTNAGFAEIQSDFGGGFYNSASVRLDSNSRYGDRFTWHLAPVFLLTETGTKLKATIGTGFKAPSLQQLFGPYGHNPNLKPETSTGYDVGLEQAFGALKAGVTWFHNDIANLIDYDAGFTPINVAKARTQGVESFLTWKLDAALGLRADYTYTDATNPVTKAALLRRPHHKASLTADWRLSDLTLAATLLYIGPRPDIGRESFAPERLPGAATLDLAASYRLSDGLRLSGRVENLFDTHYQNPDGFLRPGIGAYAGLEAEL
jgi:vitamin B12 transporter